MSRTEASITAPGDELLQRVAAALGIPVDAFYVLPAQHVFHIGADGTRWLLTSDRPGLPMVRCLSARASDRPGEDESVVAFLVRNLDSSQGQALAALIERVLTMHLHLDMRR